MKILLCCNSIYSLTGSEIYFYELSETLCKLNHKVTLSANKISDYFKNKTYQFQMKYLNEIEDKYDLIIISHSCFTFYENIQLYNEKTPIINIIHSEIYESEKPLMHKNVIKYVGVRETICNKFINLFPKIECIYNPIDTSKFNLLQTCKKPFGLFVGTPDQPRYESMKHFCNYCKYNNLVSINISGDERQSNLFDICMNKVDNIEKYFKSCSISGGILKGRTYFEAKLCGKPLIEYYIDENFFIKNIEYEDPINCTEEYNILINKLNKFEVAKQIIKF